MAASEPPTAGVTAGGSMLPSASPGTENVAQPRPTESARSPSARADAASAHTTITGNSWVGRGVKATKPLNCATSAAAVADKDNKNPSQPAATSAKPGFDPKPVQVGGESLVERLVPYMKQIVIGLVALAAVISIVFTVKYFKDRGRREETAKLAKVIEISQRQVRPPGVEPDPKAKEPTFASNKERAQAVLDAMVKEGVQTGGAFRASMLLQAGRLDDAIAEYRKHQSGKTLDAVLAREGLGLALEMKAEQEKDAATRQKGLEEALTVFQSMQPDEKGPRYAYALYHQGRILALLGKVAEAKTQLQKAKELGAGTKLPELIDERLAGLDA
jgi:hypothetical protein